MNGPIALGAMLVVLGAASGLTQPLTKTTVSMGHRSFLVGGQLVVPRGTLGVAGAMLVAPSVLHPGASVGHVRMIGRAGSVFAAQVSYLVTSFGVVWSILILGESCSGWIWLALAAMMSGLALVQPRPGGAEVAALRPIAQDAAQKSGMAYPQ